MEIKKNLESFYNEEAEKYYFSRKKYRADWYIILEKIKESPKETISILEFWCGSWRLISFLNKNIENKKIIYTWVDLSKKIIDFASKDNPKNNFIHKDIYSYIKNIKQESLDFIIWIASFQHIPNKKERIYLIKSFYKSLSYWWKLIIINRSISKWFIKKYYKCLINSFIKYIYTVWKYSRNDIYIPRKGKNKIRKRYYHIFTKNEINALTKIWWFKTILLTYIDRKWQKINNRKNSNNTIFIWEKDI